jgi:cardiolipin synthase
VRIGNAVTAAITNRRLLEPVEAHIAMIAGGALFGLAVLAIVFPRGLSYPLAAILGWFGLALLYRGFRLHTPHDRQR